MTHLFQSQVIQAITYLAKVWANEPGNSEDHETCAIHALTLRALLDELNGLPVDTWVPRDSIHALVHRAREKGFAAGELEICNGCGQRFASSELRQDTVALWYCLDCEDYGHWEQSQ